MESKDTNKSNLLDKLISEKGKSDLKKDTEVISATNQTDETVTRSDLKNKENISELLPSSMDEEIEVIAVIEVRNENKLSADSVGKNKRGFKAKENEGNLIPPKSLISLKGEVPNKDIACSPVKVVVERLPDIVISANQLESQKEAESFFEIHEKKSKAVKNISPSLNVSNHDLNCNNLDKSSLTQKASSCVKTTRIEGGTLFNLDNIGDTRKTDEPIEESNNLSISVDNKISLSKNEGCISEKSEKEIMLVDEVNSESIDKSPPVRKTRSMDKTETPCSVNLNGEIDSINLNKENLVCENVEQHLEGNKGFSEVKTGLDLLKTPPVSASDPSDTSNSPYSSSKPRSSENTPVKSGQKQLKQTQLPFTPIRKVVESKSDFCSESGSSADKTKSLRSDGKEEKSCLLVLKRVETQEIKKPLQSTTSNSVTEKVSESEAILDSTVTNNEAIGGKSHDESNIQSQPENVSQARQEVERTPEKASPNMVFSLQRSEAEVVEPPNRESSSNTTDSEDIIASSQETDVMTQSILLSFRNSSSSNSVKLLSKSPKKCENASLATTSSDRVLRSSPLKIENSRFTGTPVKKSVCRRLDVEIEESPEPNELDSESISCKIKSVGNQNPEELSNDFKLLNGDGGSNKNIENPSLPSSRVTEIINNLEEPQSLSSDYSPRSHKSLKRFVVETDANSTSSPKRTMGSLRFETNGSPISSPNSRTSQMMELAKQETEKTISSPVSSIKRRRILPTRVGPVTRTPKSNMIQRTHNGPSEEWVRRTYSPSASPNSSILKRTHQQPISPDCSPPSSKKKRVSFLDPPVSESLLFSKANPGKGQIQRPEPKPDMESEELPSQGSVGVELVETFNSEAKVFSPLKHCCSPLTDILERIVNSQWMSELESQLERLGVTTVGELSSLPEQTVQRLPFIPPKLERLRKILQNYHNEISEKPNDPKLIDLETKTNQEDRLSPENVRSDVVTKSPVKTVDPVPETNETSSPESPDNETSSPESPDNEISSPESPDKARQDIVSIAENIKHQIEQYPEVISELGKKLHIDTVMKLLNFAVNRLKKENDKS